MKRPPGAADRVRLWASESWEYFTSWWVLPVVAGAVALNIILLTAPIGGDKLLHLTLRALGFGAVLAALYNDRRKANKARKRFLGRRRNYR